LNLSVKIARLQLSIFPDVIARRILLREDVIMLAEWGSAEIDAIGEFHFADIRTALSNGEFGVPRDVPRRRGGGAIILTRFETGLHSARLSDEAEVILPQFALLDPDISVRLSAYSEIVSQTKPCWPNCCFWQTVLAERPLSDSEFGCVINELQHVAERELARIAVVLAGGGFGVSDLIPSDLSYYESLIGTVTAIDNVDEYVSRELMPHLEKVFKADSVWGLRCIQGVCISAKLDVSAVTRSATNDDLISTLQAAGPGETSFSKLATIQIAQSRMPSDPRFSDLANEALSSLLGQTALDCKSVDHNELFPAFIRLTLNTISQSEQFWSAPPYWRRLAAFAHATILLETFDFSIWNKAKLVVWCDAQLSMATAAVAILDRLREPLWRGDMQTATNLSLEALIRAVKWSPESDNSLLGLSSMQMQQIHTHLPIFHFVFGLPSPVSDKKYHQGSIADQTIGEELLQGLSGEDLQAAPLNSHQTWKALTYSARNFAFSSELLGKIRDMASEIHLEDEEISGEQYEILMFVAELAALQADQELAGILATSLLNVVEHIVQPFDSVTCASILVTASGAIADWPGSLAWAADRLEVLAYRIPRGVCSEETAAWIETMQRFIPLKERRWGKAWIISRSAIR
jgi:hypothetical protein